MTPTEHLTSNSGALIPASRQCDSPRTPKHQVPVSPGSESIDQPLNWSLVSFLPHYLNKMAFNILLPDQEGYSKSVGTGKSYRWWVFSPHIISLSKRLPSMREHRWGTNKQEWLDSKMGWWRGDFFDSCHNPAVHRPFLLKNNRARERARRIHYLIENVLSTYHIPGTDLGAEGSVVNKREEPLALMELLIMRRQTKRKKYTHTQNVRRY